MDLESGEMNDTVDVGVLLEDIVKGLFARDVDVVVFWLLAADQLYSVQSLWGRVVEVVDDDDFVTSFEESQGSEGADVASATEKLSVAIFLQYHTQLTR